MHTLSVNESEKKVIDFIRKSGVARVVATLPREGEIATSEPPKGPEHDKLVRRLAHHAHCPFEAGELANKSLDYLRKLDSMARGKTRGDGELPFSVNNWYDEPETTESDSELPFEVTDWHDES